MLKYHISLLAWRFPNQNLWQKVLGFISYDRTSKRNKQDFKQRLLLNLLAGVSSRDFPIQVNPLHLKILNQAKNIPVVLPSSLNTDILTNKPRLLFYKRIALCKVFFIRAKLFHLDLKNQAKTIPVVLQSSPNLNLRHIGPGTREL